MLFEYKFVKEKNIDYHTMKMAGQGLIQLILKPTRENTYSVSSIDQTDLLMKVLSRFAISSNL